MFGRDEDEELEMDWTGRLPCSGPRLRPLRLVESNTSSSLIPSMASRLSGESGKDESGVLPTAAAEADDGI